MKKYTGFFKNCRIDFRGETFKVIAYDMLDIHEIDLPNDDLVWKKSNKTLEQIDADDAGERICFTQPSYFSDHGYYCFVEYYLDGDDDNGVFRIKGYEFVYPDDTERIAELDKIVKNSQGVYLK